MRPTLQTERLTLRPLAFSDRDAMVDRIMSDPDVMAWLPGSDKVSTLEGQRDVASDYLAGFIESWDNLGFGAWAVCIGHAEGGSLGRFIGYCGFIPGQIEGAGPEIAYAIGKALWGQGIVTEALNAGLQWIFTETAIPRVYAVTDKGNTRSRRVLEKLGMTHAADVDLYDSVVRGEGLLPFYAIERGVYLEKGEP